jgi:hypothetical protein
MKTCFKCSQKLPLEAFYKHAQMKDGRLNKCMSCTKADANANRLANIEKYKAYDKYRASAPHRVAARTAYRATEAGKAAVKRAHRKWEANNPERRAARHAVSNALRDGRIRKLECFVCGSPDTEAHHSDYDNALAVVWLCVVHHKQIHKEHAALAG